MRKRLRNGKGLTWKLSTPIPYSSATTWGNLEAQLYRQKGADPTLPPASCAGDRCKPICPRTLCPAPIVWSTPLSHPHVPASAGAIWRVAGCPPSGCGCQGPRGEQLGGWADPRAMPVPGLSLRSSTSQPRSGNGFFHCSASCFKTPGTSENFLPGEFPSLRTHHYPTAHSREGARGIKASQTP